MKTIDLLYEYGVNNNKSKLCIHILELQQRNLLRDHTKSKQQHKLQTIGDACKHELTTWSVREIGRGPLAENAREGLELLCLPRWEAKGCQMCRAVLDVTAARPHVGPAAKLGDLLVRAAFAEAPRSSATSQEVWPEPQFSISRSFAARWKSNRILLSLRPTKFSTGERSQHK